VSTLEVASGIPSIEVADAKINLSIYDANSRIGKEKDTNENAGTNPTYQQYYFEYRIYPTETRDGFNLNPNFAKSGFGAGVDPTQSVTPSIPLTGSSPFWPNGLDSLPDGNWKLDVRVYDRAGNSNSVTGIEFKVNRIAPVVTITPTLDTLRTSFNGTEVDTLTDPLINLSSITVKDGDLASLTIKVGSASPGRPYTNAYV